MFISLFAVTLVNESTGSSQKWNDAFKCRIDNTRYAAHTHIPLEVETLLLLLVAVVLSIPLPCQYFCRQ